MPYVSSPWIINVFVMAIVAALPALCNRFLNNAESDRKTPEMLEGDATEDGGGKLTALSERSRIRTLCDVFWA
ncbi:hypothetical protein L0F51_08015 [Afifella sp. H1R]|uniref:hypothetical protein n=1 Tax=Afifella sp. H1R TaxID=2908841 RepID=UPI001F2DA57D|nr:hypothetical protein [Afifella sp. H1R]MCF1503704.1 hypothetical protein [Afifella sp. H1R]